MHQRAVRMRRRNRYTDAVSLVVSIFVGATMVLVSPSAEASAAKIPLPHTTANSAAPTIDRATGGTGVSKRAAPDADQAQVGYGSVWGLCSGPTEFSDCWELQVLCGGSWYAQSDNEGGASGSYSIFGGTIKERWIYGYYSEFGWVFTGIWSGSAGVYVGSVTQNHAPPEEFYLVPTDQVASCSGVSSLPVPAITAGGVPGDAQTTCSCGDPINTATGDFWRTFTDLTVPGPGDALDLTRTYASNLAAVKGRFGYGWTDSYAMSLSFSSDDVTVNQGDGSQVTYDPTGGGGFTGPSWDFATLTKVGSDYEYTRDSGQIYDFNASGNLTSEIDRDGDTTSLSYNSKHELTKVKDPAGRSLTFDYNAAGETTSVTGPGGLTTRYTYNSDGNLITAKNAGGGIWKFIYDVHHHLLTMADPMGRTTTNVYTGSQVTKQIDPLHHVTTYSYSSPGAGLETTVVTDPLGHVTRFQYGNLELLEVDQSPGASSATTTLYVHDPITQAVSFVTDPAGNTTFYGYDAEGDVVAKIDALGEQTTYTYNAYGEPLTVTDPMGVTTTYTYSARGNLLSVSTPLTGTDSDATTTYVYGDTSYPGLVTSVTDPDGNTTRLGYDHNGDVTSITDPEGHASKATYNVLGERLTETTPMGDLTKFTYDPLGDVLTTTDPLGGVTRRQYDADQELISVVDPTGSKTRYLYDADGQLTRTIAANGSATTDAYDVDGDRVKTTNAEGKSTTYTYDDLGELVATTDSLGHVTRDAYDLAGNLTSTTNALGEVTQDAYNADNELTSISYSSAGMAPVAFTYDADGRVTSMSDGTGTTTYVYDSLGRLVSSTNGSGQTVAYGYDLDGDATSISYANGDTVSRGYDADGDLTSVADWLGHSTRFSYNANGELTTEAYGSSPAVTDSFTYDRNGDVLSITDRSGSRVLQRFTYTRNADGLLSSIVSPGQSTQLTYNDVDELTRDASGTYSYDPAGSVTALLSAKPMAYNADGQLTSQERGRQR